MERDKPAKPAPKTLEKLSSVSISDLPSHKVPKSFKKRAEAGKEIVELGDQSSLPSPLQPLGPRKAWGSRKAMKKLQGVLYPPRSK